MTLIEFSNKHGRTEALKAIGEKKLASDLEEAEKYIESVVDNEGIVPFEKRPKSTQLKINAANAISFKAKELIWQKRRQIMTLE